MKIKSYQGKLILCLVISAFSNFASGQVAVMQSQNQKALLYSGDPKLARNKKIVYDFWREVLEAGHMELASQFLAESYIQHNPNVPTGRQSFIDLFSKYMKPQPFVDSIKTPLVAIVAENDLVVFIYKIELPDPKNPSKNYTTTGFDMFRIEGDKIAEHWDTATKQ